MIVVLLVVFYGNILWSMNLEQKEDNKLLLSSLLSKEGQSDSSSLIKESENFGKLDIKNTIKHANSSLEKQKKALLFAKKAGFFIKKINEDVAYISGMINQKSDPNPHLRYPIMVESHQNLFRIYCHLNFSCLEWDHDKTLTYYWQHYVEAIKHYYRFFNKDL